VQRIYFTSYLAESFASARRGDFATCRTLERTALGELRKALGLAPKAKINYKKLSPRQRRELLTLAVIGTNGDASAVQ
jgi:hypothetical protein